jgi:NADH-quinone oxidoreductase subunit H
MALGWKVLIPVSLAWIMIVAITHSLRAHGYQNWATGLIGAAVVVVGALAAVLWKSLQRRAVPPPPDQGAGAYPVPPLPTVRKETADA